MHEPEVGGLVSQRAEQLEVGGAEPGAGRRADELWRHTCFEAFIAVPGTRAYYEFNFSPGLDWAAYRFEAYREGMTAPALQSPAVTVRRDAHGLELAASVALESLALPAAAARLRLALAAVIETADGRVDYWALAHPAGKPDFHHPQGFTLELPRP